MKKIALYIIVVLIGFIAVTSCNRPKVIPDSQLKVFFKEVYLTNAYLSNNRYINTDSLDIYESILRKHGYTVSDLEYTIMNFSRRKSSRLGDVLERAIEELQAESEYFNAKVAVLDTIEKRAERIYADTLINDSSIYVNAIRDTSKLRFIIPVDEATYVVYYNYFIDTLDKNTNLRSSFSVFAYNGIERNMGTNFMNKGRELNYTARINTLGSDSLMVVKFAGYGTNLTKPDIRIDSLTVVKYLPKDIAIDSLYRTLYTIKIPELSYEPTDTQDSVTLYLPSELPTAEVGSGDRRQFRADN